jgi:periplasmic protein TonB
MFRESLLDECTDHRSRRGWTTVTSFALQITASCVCVVLPLLYPEALPLIHADSQVLMPVPAGTPAPLEHASAHRDTRATIDNSPIIRQPSAIPTEVSMTPDQQTTASLTPPGVIGIPEGIGSRDTSPVMRDLIGATGIHAVVKPPVVNSVRMSAGVSQGMLISRIEPRYPDLARRSHIQGEVVLAAIIGRDGRIENLHVVSGHPWLAQAAIEAVRQWRYRPYLLNAEAVEVETQLTVRFRLNGSD